MKQIQIAIVGFTVVLLGMIVALRCINQPLAQRVAPVPAAASDALRDELARYPVLYDPDYFEAPRSEAQWHESIKRNNLVLAAQVPYLLNKYSISVDRISMHGVGAYRLSPQRISEGHKANVFLYLHSGAFVFGAGEAGLAEPILISDRLGITVFSVDYRMPPSHPFPAAVNDVVTAYRTLLDDYPASSIVIGGTSAGGGLAIASAMRLRELGLDVPSAIYVGSPWVDLTKTGDTWFTNQGLDRVLPSYEGLIAAAARLYAANRVLTSPLLSPIYGSFHDFPPVIIVAGTRDLLLSDAARLHRRLRSAGVVSELYIVEGMSHADHIIIEDSPESMEIYKEIDNFVGRHLQ